MERLRRQLGEQKEAEDLLAHVTEVGGLGV